MGRSLTRVDRKRRRISRKVSMSFSSFKSHSLTATSFPVFIAGVRSTTRRYPFKASFPSRLPVGWWQDPRISKAYTPWSMGSLRKKISLVCSDDWPLCPAFHPSHFAFHVHQSLLIKSERATSEGDLAVTHLCSQDPALSSSPRVFRGPLPNLSLSFRCQGRRRSLCSSSETVSDM